MRKIEVSGRTVEKAIAKGLKELGVKQEDVDIKILNEGGLFRRARVQLTCDNSKSGEKVSSEIKTEKITSPPVTKKPKVTDEEEILYIEDFLRKLISKMGLKADISSTKVKEDLIFSASGEELGRLIGRHGETLNAIQTIIINICRNKGFPKKAYFDIGNYKNRREDSLTSLAKEMAKKAVKTGKPVKLERLNAYERKIVHMALQGNEEVTTKSEGEEPDRYLIIFPKK